MLVVLLVALILLMVISSVAIFIKTNGTNKKLLKKDEDIDKPIDKLFGVSMDASFDEDETDDDQKVTDVVTQINPNWPYGVMTFTKTL